MYFKIGEPEKDKYCGLGMININAAFYLEKGDDGYDKYIAEHLVDGELNPFCNHSIQFEANVTEEEILWCFEFAMAMTHSNYLIDDLRCATTGKTVNQPINYLSRKAFYAGVKQIPAESQNAYEKAELAKCVAAENKIDALKEIDFKTVETIAAYRVK